jgi:hypothetical protein
MQSRRMSGSTSSHSLADKGKYSSSDRGRVQDKVPQKAMQGPHSMGCNRPGHQHEECLFRAHPDFHQMGRWDGCKAEGPRQEESGP